MFYVGQSVVCVDDDERFGPMDGLKRDRIYTIRSLDVDPILSMPAMKLEEIRRPFRYGYERGYDRRRFRPITERKTDISQFEKLLDMTGAGVVA